ncbi:MAG: nucleoside deaminase [Patulibacter sp.]
MAERDEDLRWLRRAIELSAEARKTGNPPFGSLLVGPDGTVLAEDRNTEYSDNDISAHPEFKLSVWAGRELDAETAAGTTMYTSCENCAMCTSALIRAGVGRVVYAMSAERLGAVRGVRPTDLKLPLREVVSRAAHEVDVVGPLIEDESAAIQDGFWD